MADTETPDLLDRFNAAWGDHDLDTALALFEEGVARLRAARERLVAAELKVQAVLEEADGDIRLTNLDA